MKPPSGENPDAMHHALPLHARRNGATPASESRAV
jgi:hypothetical protein